MTKQYRLVASIRVDAEEEAWMTDSYEEALAEKEQQEFLCPENIYRIEEVDNDADHREGAGCAHQASHGI